jgi:hypothetical protein
VKASEPVESLSEGRDLVERIETTRFLGPEFLVWLWFTTELFESELELRDGTSLSVWLEAQLWMKGASDGGERIHFTGVAPSTTSEAKLALRRGKLPVRARVCLRQDPEDFSCVYDAETFSFGSVKVPALIAEPGDEQFRERVTMLERFDQLWNSLYAEFLKLRLSPAWESVLLPAVKAWAAGSPTLTTKAYRAMLRK